MTVLNSGINFNYDCSNHSHLIRTKSNYDNFAQLKLFPTNDFSNCYKIKFGLKLFPTNDFSN